MLGPSTKKIKSLFEKYADKIFRESEFKYGKYFGVFEISEDNQGGFIVDTLLTNTIYFSIWVCPVGNLSHCLNNTYMEIYKIDPIDGKEIDFFISNEDIDEIDEKKLQKYITKILKGLE